jgi:hypothetical protein
MTPKTQFNVRLPDYTIEQIELIQQTYGLTQVQVIILAVDRLTRDLNPDRPAYTALATAQEMAASPDETYMPRIGDATNEYIEGMFRDQP